MHLGKKTKIVCTIGPVSSSEEKLAELLKAGMNVMRLNFSHGDFTEHQARLENLKKASKKTGIPVAVLQDLGGPKIRLGTFKGGFATLVEGKKFTLTTEKIEGDETRVHVNYPLLPKEVTKGHIIFLHDGRKKLEVLDIKGNDVICKILVGGDIKDKRGVNLPDSELTIRSLTDKDKKDLEFGIKNDVDFIALSFVRRPSDIEELRVILDKRKCKAGIIAKIETPQAVANIDKIIELCDGIMVARGDLAIEIPAEDVPIVRKMIINKCNAAGKPVITATQMLESMIKSPVPTRAEVSDVANAILDGTDAIMLSEETTLGDYPVKAVEVMTRVALRIESDYLHQQLLDDDVIDAMIKGVGESMTSSAVKIANVIQSKYIVSLTNSGRSARMISRYKPSQLILVFTPHTHTFQKSLLNFGCYPVLIKSFTDLKPVLKIIRDFSLKHKLGKKGDNVVIVSGMPFGKVIETNMVLVETL